MWVDETKAAGTEEEEEEEEEQHQQQEEDEEEEGEHMEKESRSLFVSQQLRPGAVQRHDPHAPFWVRYRRLIALGVPALAFHVFWWSYMAAEDRLGLFASRSEGIPVWYMSVTMIFASMLAGATSEGGAAIAFPVMTIVFSIPPATARDFSFMVQSCGMVAAAATIAIQQVQMEWHAVVYASIGGVVGIIFGLEEVAPTLEPPYSKMYFVSVWLSFAVALFFINRYHDRIVYQEVPDWEQGELFSFQPFSDRPWRVSLNWKACVLFAFGFLGGIFSAISGSGLDICTFSVLCLLFRVSERVATPTSVVLMAGNTVTGFLYREFGQGGVEDGAWPFLLVTIPIVVIGAPLGSIIGSHLHRLALASMIYITDTTQFIGALAVVRPWSNRNTDTPLHLCLTSAAILIGGGIGFTVMAWLGQQQIIVQQRAAKWQTANALSDSDSDVDDEAQGGASRTAERTGMEYPDSADEEANSSMAQSDAGVQLQLQRAAAL